MAKYRYLLDTYMVSELIKNPQGVVAERMLSSGLELLCCTSIIVACELRYNAEKKQSPNLSFNVEQVLNSLPILPLEEPIDELYSKIRVSLENKGVSMSQHELLVAAHALSLGLTVVTENDGKFSHIDNLTVENWLID
jgi:tRNA(fMet)-specific endonuclease VapC